MAYRGVMDQKKYIAWIITVKNHTAGFWDWERTTELPQNPCTEVLGKIKHYLDEQVKNYYITYHEGEEEYEGPKPWNKHNHLHILFEKVFHCDVGRHGGLRSFNEKIRNATGEKASIQVAHTPAGLLYYMNKPPRRFLGAGGYFRDVAPPTLEELNEDRQNAKRSLDDEDELTMMTENWAKKTKMQSMLKICKEFCDYNDLWSLSDIKRNMTNLNDTHVCALLEMQRNNAQFKTICDMALNCKIQEALQEKKLYDKYMFTWNVNNRRNRGTKYHCLVDSVKILRLINQKSGIVPFKLLQAFKGIMNRETAKINTLVLHGESNSGKSLLANSLKAPFPLTAECRAEGNTDFMWQAGLNKMLICLNEPCFEPNKIDQVKLILEGHETEVRVKHNPDEVLNSTPVMITTNKNLCHLCPEDRPAIENRCITFKGFTNSPELAEYNYQINPKVWQIIHQNEGATYEDLLAVAEVWDINETGGLDI